MAGRRDLDPSAAGALKAVLESGEAARIRLLAVRENLQAEASELDLQKRWSENCQSVLSAG